jgi:hypothetical protein
MIDDLIGEFQAQDANQRWVFKCRRISFRYVSRSNHITADKTRLSGFKGKHVNLIIPVSNKYVSFPCRLLTFSEDVGFNKIFFLAFPFVWNQVPGNLVGD